MHPLDGSVRRVIRIGVGIVAAGAAVWAGALFLGGGFEARVLGVFLASHDPYRPLLIASLALAIFMFLGGDAVVVRAVGLPGRLARRGWADAAPVRARVGVYDGAGHLDRAAVSALILIAVTFGVVDGSKAAGGSDAYGYLSEADLWQAGRLEVPQPWTRDIPWPDARWSFAPLGYSPSRARSSFSILGYRPPYDPLAIVPTYSPGLPMLMALAALAAGECAKYWVVPLSGAALLLSMYGLGRRLGSRRLGTVAAFLCATSPPFITHQMVTNTDVPITAAWALAWWGLLGRSIGSACGAAVAVALAILIRPNLVPLAVVVACWVALRIWSSRTDRRRHVLRGAIVLAGAAVGIGTIAAIYWTLYGSPLESGYGPTANLFSLAYVRPNIGKYAEQFLDAQTVVGFFGLAALFVPAKRLWPGTGRTTLLAFAFTVVAVWAEFCCYLTSDSALRFLLPCYPFILLGLASLAIFVARLDVRGISLAAAAIVIVLGVRGVDQMLTRGAFRQWSDEVMYIDVAEQVRAATPDNSVIIAMQHSGSLRYYAGRVTLRWDYLPPDWLDRGVAWLDAHGAHAFVLIDGWERDLIRKRFAGQSLLARLDGPPLFTLADRYLYDLGPSPTGPGATRVIPERPLRGHCEPAVPVTGPAWGR